MEIVYADKGRIIEVDATNPYCYCVRREHEEPGRYYYLDLGGLSFDYISRIEGLEVAQLIHKHFYADAPADHSVRVKESREAKV